MNKYQLIHQQKKTIRETIKILSHINNNFSENIKWLQSLKTTKIDSSTKNYLLIKSAKRITKIALKDNILREILYNKLILKKKDFENDTQDLINKFTSLHENKTKEYQFKILLQFILLEISRRHNEKIYKVKYGLNIVTKLRKTKEKTYIHHDTV